MNLYRFVSMVRCNFRRYLLTYLRVPWVIVGDRSRELRVGVVIWERKRVFRMLQPMCVDLFLPFWVGGVLDFLDKLILENNLTERHCLLCQVVTLSMVFISFGRMNSVGNNLPELGGILRQA